MPERSTSLPMRFTGRATTSKRPTTISTKRNFNKAKEKFKAGYVRNGSGHPIDDSGEVSQATAALNGHREQLSRIAVDFDQVAAALAQAQRDSDAEIASLDGQLHDLDDQTGVRC
jgi:ABC-type transporter Mla subunit MlaD